MGEPQDLQYIDNMLQGVPGTSGGRVSAPAGRRGRGAGRSDRGRGAAPAPRSSSRSRVRADQTGAADTSSQQQGPPLSTSSGSAARGRDVAAANAGAGGSNSSGGRQCELCGCRVGGGSDSWQTHVAGIQHRRQELSVREKGAPGHKVVSVFESDADDIRHWEEQQEQQRRRRQSGAQAADSSQEQLPPAVRAIMGPLRRELINYCDAEVYRTIMPEMAGMFDLDMAVMRLSIIGGKLACPWHPSLLLLPAMVEDLPPLERLVISANPGFPLETNAPVLAATLAQLGAALPSLPDLTEVVVRWTRPTHRQMDAMLLRAASRFLHNAAAVLASWGPGCPRRISIQLGGQHDPDATPERLFAARDAFTATLASAAAACRQALLMSIHPKSAAAGCLIGHLPAALLGSVMAIGLPLQPCTCTISLMQPEEYEAARNQHRG